MKGEHEMKIPVRTENGWQIDAILDTTYVATKDGESVTLEADTLEQMELLIALREGLVKHEIPIRRPDGSEDFVTHWMPLPTAPNCGAEMRKEDT